MLVVGDLGVELQRVFLAMALLTLYLAVYRWRIPSRVVERLSKHGGEHDE